MDLLNCNEKYLFPLVVSIVLEEKLQKLYYLRYLNTNFDPDVCEHKARYKVVICSTKTSVVHTYMVNRTVSKPN